ncbi:nitroreductase family protein [Pseudonocardia sp. T1-2H]|uniref:nitroreductase family protein n=1 Tax=Pseudonocardia sp. T1-2H TaxID=3128899 RepID=UPI003100E625
METWDAIRSRRNVRVYEDRPIPRADLERILEAGRRAPSSQNWQPWDFVVVTDREQLRRLAGVWHGGSHVAASAATIALVAPQPEDARQRDWIHYDFGQATMNMMVTAADLGIGSGHSAVADQDLARRILGNPDTTWCQSLIAMGYPADRPLTPIQRPNRRPFDDVVHWGRWSGGPAAQ